MTAVVRVAARRGVRAVRRVAVVVVQAVGVVSIVARPALIVRLTLALLLGPQPQPQQPATRRRHRLSSVFARPQRPMLRRAQRLTLKENKHAATCTQKIPQGTEGS